MTDKIIVLVTCGSKNEARRIARALVEARLAACVNVLQAPVESIYRWKGKVETAREFLLVIKTSRKRFAALEAEVRRLHSYDVPEIIALLIECGSQPYLAWIQESVKQTSATRALSPDRDRRSDPPHLRFPPKAGSAHR
jgi:periplasmic divalent cation tolerance protein